MADRSLLNVEDIYDFAKTVDLEDVRDVIGRQIAYNSAISEDGLQNDWGANIGSVLLKAYGDDIRVRARAAAAAGSDARMSGCELPVIINSGSGNQGMTASLPVIEYAKELGSSEEELYRALVLSNLITIHQKTGIGRLSAYCGAVSAACGAGAGITYLSGGSYEQIIRPSPTPSSTALPSCRALSATAPSRPVRVRSRPRWTPESWDTICISMVSSLKAATASCPREWKIPSLMWAVSEKME